MILKIGDRISVTKKGSPNREGIIDSINISLLTTDKTGDLGVSVKEYDTELKYNGSVGYTDYRDYIYWSYFYQIEKKIIENGAYENDKGESI